MGFNVYVRMWVFVHMRGCVGACVHACVCVCVVPAVICHVKEVCSRGGRVVLESLKQTAMSDLEDPISPGFMAPGGGVHAHTDC